MTPIEVATAVITTAGTATAGTGTVEERMGAAVEAAVAELAPRVGTRAAGAAVGRSRATHYRGRRAGTPVNHGHRRTTPRIVMTPSGS